MKKLTIEEVQNNKAGTVLFQYLRGSHLYGLNTETSDEDYSLIYACPITQLLGLKEGYQDQVSDEKNDFVAYELQRWLELLIKSNPNMLEGLFVPENKMIVKPHPLIQPIFDNKEKFLTKNCLTILKNYAHSQISKAQGLNKAIVNPIENRLGLLDFCYTPHKQGSTHIRKWLEYRGLKQDYCGLVHLPNCHEGYGVYYDWGMHFQNCFADKDFDKLEIDDDFLKFIDTFLHYNPYYNERMLIDMDFFFREGGCPPKGYKGIVLPDESSNEVRLTSISKGEKPICIMFYNQSGYQKHCLDYKRYQDWKKNRNPERFKLNIEHGKNFDSKNISHCVRLLTMAEEIAEGKGMLLDRSNIDREFLLSIKQGKNWEYKDLMVICEEKKNKIDSLIESCSLPDNVDVDFVNDLLIQIRYEQLKSFK